MARLAGPEAQAALAAPGVFLDTEEAKKMTRPIHLTQTDLDGLTQIQAHMLLELTDNINAVCEMRQMTAEQAGEVLQRVLAVIGRIRESNRLAPYAA